MKDYIEQAVRTESKPTDAMRARLCDYNTIRLLHAAIGKATEAGELLDALKKHIFYGKPLDEVNIMEEIGDGFWYDAIICDVYGARFTEIQSRNIAKLRARYPEKFTAEAAANRDLDAERAALAGGPPLYNHDAKQTIREFPVEQLIDKDSWGKAAGPYIDRPGDLKGCLCDVDSSRKCPVHP